MKFSYILLIGIIFIAGCGKATVVPTQTTQTIPPGMIYFHSSTCQHCALVNSYIEENNIKQKLFFISREVSSDKDAYNLIQVVGKRCGISESNLAVPLFWDGTTCYLGDENIISFFKSQTQ